jgi:hypothetical protein
VIVSCGGCPLCPSAPHVAMWLPPELRRASACARRLAGQSHGCHRRRRPLFLSAFLSLSQLFGFLPLNRCERRWGGATLDDETRRRVRTTRLEHPHQLGLWIQRWWTPPRVRPLFLQMHLPSLMSLTFSLSMDWATREAAEAWSGTVWLSVICYLSCSVIATSHAWTCRETGASYLSCASDLHIYLVVYWLFLIFWSILTYMHI